MSGHSTASLGARHAPHNWEYADAATRAAATGFVTADIGKEALQLDDFSSWTLTAITPTWQEKSGTGSVTSTGTLTSNALVLGNGGADTVIAAGLTTDGTSRVQLGVAGGAVGGVELRNATSGTASIVPPTGALGTAVHTLPAGTGTLFSTTTKADVIDAACFAADAGSNDTYAATLAPAITAYVTGAHYRFKANTANTGACTINFNSLGAKTIKKVAGGITTDLADNDIRVGQWVDLVYDGTNMQMQSLLGNAPAGGASTSEGTSTSTGTQNDFAHSNVSLLRMNNATAVTITGLVAGTAGQVIKIVSIGAGQVNFTNQDTGSSAANRIINQVSNTISLAAGKGTVTLVYDATTARWRVTEHMQGDVIQTTYSSGNFSASGSMVWSVDSGDQVTYTYCLVGKLLQVFLQIDSTTIGGTPSIALQIVIPGGFVAAWGQYVPCHVIDNGTGAIGIAQVVATGTTIYVYRSPASPNWSATTNDCSLRVAMTIAVQ